MHVPPRPTTAFPSTRASTPPTSRAQSIVQKLAVTAETTPFVVHGNEKRLSPSSLQWTAKAQAERDPAYLRFLGRQAKCAGFHDAVEAGLDAYQRRVFAGLGGDRRGRARLRDRFVADYTYAICVGDDYYPPSFADYEPPKDVRGHRQLHQHLLAWFDAGGGDGWAKLARAYAHTHRFPAAGALRDFLRQRRADFEVRAPTEFQNARERICERAVALVCTCAAVGGLVRADPLFADCVDGLATACRTLVVDEAGTCADACLVPALARDQRGQTFERLVLIGDASQLPPFARIFDPADAPVSLIERAHAVVGSALLTMQYRMFEQLCHLISTLYYDGRLATGKPDPSGTLEVHSVAGAAEQEQRGTSLFNDAEARRAADLARKRLASGGTVAVMAFYKAQVRRIAAELDDTDAVVLSVDSAQGQEFDHVVLTCVVGGSRRSFLQDRRRMNVALSRAKKSLDVVMHPTLSQRIDALASVEASAGGGHVALVRPVRQGYSIGRGRGRFGKARERGRAR